MVHLYPVWAGVLIASVEVPTDTVPIAARAPVVLGLLAVRRSWATAAAAALATPAFYMHSCVLLYPVLPLLREGRPAPAVPAVQGRSDRLDCPEGG